MSMMVSQILKSLHSSKTQISKYLANKTIFSSNKKIHSLYINNSYHMAKNNFPVEVTFDGNDDGKSSIVLNLFFLVTLFTVGLFICSSPHGS